MIDWFINWQSVSLVPPQVTWIHPICNVNGLGVVSLSALSLDEEFHDIYFCRIFVPHLEQGWHKIHKFVALKFRKRECEWSFLWECDVFAKLSDDGRERKPSHPMYVMYFEDFKIYVEMMGRDQTHLDHVMDIYRQWKGPSLSYNLPIVALVCEEPPSATFYHWWCDLSMVLSNRLGATSVTYVWKAL